MNISEFRDIFLAEYQFECQKRKIEKIEIGNLMIASWIAEAQQDIVTRIKPIKTYQDVSILANVTDYQLNSNFGMPFKARLGDSDGVIGDVVCELLDTPDLLKADNNTNGKAAIYWDASNSAYYIKVPTPASAYTIRIWYYPDTLWYSPSGSTSQDWGAMSSAGVFTGNLKIPDKFQMAIKYFLLGKCFNDFSNYENMIAKLKVNKVDTMKRKFDYNYNTGYSDEFTDLSNN